MVFSRINPKVEYLEEDEVHTEDANCHGELYKTKIHNILVGITVGKENRMHINDNIIFFPIYLLKSNHKCIRIGIYEMEKNKKINVQKMQPLIYSKITPEFLKRQRYVIQPEKKQLPVYSEDNRIQEIRMPFFSLMVGKPIPSMLKEETEEENKSIMENFKKNRNPSWIQSFFKNNNYTIHDIEDHEGIFHTIRNAFLSIGQETTVTKLRELIAANVSEEKYYQYQELYKEFLTISSLLKERLKKIKHIYDEIEKQIRMEIDYEKKVIMLKKIVEVKKARSILLRQQENTEKILRTVKFMNGVTTFKQFKTKLRTSSYPYEAFIEILELSLNIKCIFLSSKYYYQEDMENVVVCSPDLSFFGNSEDKYFEPDYYILLDDKYRLICYKGRCVFTYKELPYSLKKIILNKCIEQKTIFNFIPEFIATKPPYKEKHDNLQLMGDVNLYDLFDEQIEFIYSPLSCDEIPGRLGGEKVPTDEMKHFLGLPENWRKKLSNDWIEPFVFENRRWASVTHLYEAMKHKSKPEYTHFSLDSGSPVASDVSLAKRYLGKPDEDFERNKYTYMQQALLAKWQKEEMKKLLLATKKATLMEFKRGAKPERAYILMDVRKKLNT